MLGGNTKNGEIWKKIWIITALISVVMSSLAYFNVLNNIIVLIVGVGLFYAVMTILYIKKRERNTETEYSFLNLMCIVFGLLVALDGNIISNRAYCIIFIGLSPLSGITLGVAFIEIARDIASKKH